MIAVPPPALRPRATYADRMTFTPRIVAHEALTRADFAALRSSRVLRRTRALGSRPPIRLLACFHARHRRRCRRDCRGARRIPAPRDHGRRFQHRRRGHGRSPRRRPISRPRAGRPGHVDRASSHASEPGPRVRLPRLPRGGRPVLRAHRLAPHPRDRAERLAHARDETHAHAGRHATAERDSRATRRSRDERDSRDEWHACDERHSRDGPRARRTRAHLPAARRRPRLAAWPGRSAGPTLVSARGLESCSPLSVHRVRTFGLPQPADRDDSTPALPQPAGP